MRNYFSSTSKPNSKTISKLKSNTISKLKSNTVSKLKSNTVSKLKSNTVSKRFVLGNWFTPSVPNISHENKTKLNTYYNKLINNVRYNERMRSFFKTIHQKSGQELTIKITEWIKSNLSIIDFVTEEGKKETIDFLVYILIIAYHYFMTKELYKVRALKQLVFLMEQEGITGIIKIEEYLEQYLTYYVIEKLAIIPKESQQEFFETHLFEEKKIDKISNTLVQDIIRHITKKHHHTAGAKKKSSKVYTGSRGGKYILVKVADGSMKKKYV